MGCWVYFFHYTGTAARLLSSSLKPCVSIVAHFSFFFFEPHYRWLGYLLKTEMMMIFFDAKKSKTRGSYAVSIRDLFFFIFF